VQEGQAKGAFDVNRGGQAPSRGTAAQAAELALDECERRVTAWNGPLIGGGEAVRVFSVGDARLGRVRSGVGLRTHHGPSLGFGPAPCVGLVNEIESCCMVLVRDHAPPLLQSPSFLTDD
jgi:hypothetical protein